MLVVELGFGIHGGAGTVAMTMRIVGIVAAAAAIVLTGLPAVASASSPWHQVTGSNGANIDQVALLRTAGGTLHVAWHVPTGGSSDDLHDTSISASGTVEATTSVVAGWAAMDNPALVPAPGGAIQVLFGGIHTTNSGDPNQDLNSAVSSDGGSTWALQPGDVAAPGASAYASPISATVAGAAVVPYETWFGTPGVWVHAGLSSATPNFNYQTPFGCCGYDSNIASSALGAIMLAWYSNATGHLGVYAQRVGSDGSPIGSPVDMPGTSNMSVGELGRTPLVSRPDGDFYIAYATGYPALDRIRLWHVGSGSSTTIARVSTSGGEPTATVAAAPDGRLWVIWKQDVNDRPHVFAVRSNKTMTRFGAVVDAGAPPAAFSGYRVDGNAIASALDLFGSFSIGSSSSVATWYRRVLPGLTLTGQPAKLHRGHRTKVTFVVTDAGDPVKGAKVQADGRSGATNSKGEVKLQLTAQHTLKAAASDVGYIAASARLAVVR
jgi:hypothetical protein